LPSRHDRCAGKLRSSHHGGPLRPPLPGKVFCRTRSSSEIQTEWPSCVCKCEKKNRVERMAIPYSSRAEPPHGIGRLPGRGFLSGTPSTAVLLMSQLACETELRGRAQEPAAFLAEAVVPVRNAPLLQLPVLAREQLSPLHYRQTPAAVRVVLGWMSIVRVKAALWTFHG